MLDRREPGPKSAWPRASRPMTPVVLRPFLVLAAALAAQAPPDYSPTRSEAKWGAEHQRLVVEHLLPLPPELPADTHPRELEWRLSFVVVPPWQAPPFSGTLTRREDRSTELRARALVVSSLWSDLAHLHSLQPSAEWRSIAQQLQVREVTLDGKSGSRVASLADGVERLRISLALTDPRLYHDGVYYTLRLEQIYPRRRLQFHSGPHDEATRDWVDQLRRVIGGSSQ